MGLVWWNCREFYMFEEISVMLNRKKNVIRYSVSYESRKFVCCYWSFLVLFIFVSLIKVKMGKLVVKELLVSCYSPTNYQFELSLCQPTYPIATSINFGRIFFSAIFMIPEK